MKWLPIGSHFIYSHFIKFYCHEYWEVCAIEYCIDPGTASRHLQYPVLKMAGICTHNLTEPVTFHNTITYINVSFQHHIPLPEPWNPQRNKSRIYTCKQVLHSSHFSPNITLAGTNHRSWHKQYKRYIRKIFQWSIILIKQVVHKVNIKIH